MAARLLDLWNTAGEYNIAAALFGEAGVFVANDPFSRSELAELTVMIGAHRQAKRTDR